MLASRWRMTCLGCACLLAAAAVAQEPPAAVPTDRIEGRVLDGLAQPVAAAEVWVRDEAENVVARTRSDGDGLFVIARLPAGQPGWRVAATAPGKVEAEAWGRPREGVAMVTVRLPDAATLTGRVVDAGGKGIAGAEVLAAFDLARGASDGTAVQTDSDGRFRIERAPLGVLDVRAAAPGFRCGCERVHVRADAEVEVQLEAGGGLAVDVVVEGLRPEEMPGVRVQLRPYADGSLVHLPPSLMRGRLDGDGRWSARGLPEAEYVVQVSGQGLVFDPRQLRMYSQFRGRVLGGPDQPPTTSPLAAFCALRREPGPSEIVLTGRLVDAEGKGIAGETLVTRASNGGTEYTAVTGADGAFSIQSALAPGAEAMFFLRQSRFVTSQEQDERSSFDKRNLLWHRARVDANAELVIRAIPAAVVRGRLLDAAGTPVPFARVQLEEHSASRMPRWMAFAYGTSQADGTFELRVHPIAEPARVLVEGGAGYAESAELALASGATVDAGDLRLAPPAEVTGVVRDDQNQPVPGARVWLRDWDFAAGRQKSGSVVEAISDREGRYRFAEVPPGGAWLQVMLRAERNHERAVEPFEVKAGEKLRFDLVVREK